MAIEELTFVVDQEAPAGWNEFILTGRTDPVHVFHSTLWVNRMTEFFKLKPFYISVRRQSKNLLSLVGFSGYYPVVSYDMRSIAKRILRATPWMRRDFRWYGQPVRYEGVGLAEFEFLASNLSELIRSKGLRLAYGEWPHEFKAAIPSSWGAKEWATLKIDLSGSIDQILASFRSSARKEIRKAQEAGIQVRRIESLQELREYYQRTTLWAQRYGKTSYGFRDAETLWNQVRQSGGVYESFQAFHDSKPIAGLSILGDSEGVVEIGSFQSEESFQLKLSGPDLAKWSAIQWAKEKGIKIFDLAGVNPAPENPKEEGIRRFKQKWSSVESRYWVLTESMGF